MASLAVKLPLTLDSGDGFTMIKSMRGLIKQNLKMLLLTNPGERVMEPGFGVGMNRYLFQNFSQTTYSAIDSKIREQVAMYIPVVSIIGIEFDPIESSSNGLRVKLRYSIPTINIKDLLEFTI
jgi:phage baseplate assembly protein W